MLPEGWKVYVNDKLEIEEIKASLERLLLRLAVERLNVMAAIRQCEEILVREE